MTSKRSRAPFSGPARKSLSAVVVFAMAVAVLAVPPSVPPAVAATYDVTRTDDPAPNGCAVGDCSLREAIIDANATAANDVINLPGGLGLYTLTILGDGEDAAATGDLDILDAAVAGTLVIQGDNSINSQIDAISMEDRVFHVLPGGDLSLVDMQVAGGRTQSGVSAVIAGDPGGDGEDGAGVLNEGTLTLLGVWLTNNVTGSGGNGADGTTGGAGGRGGNGAAVYSTGPVTMTSSLIFGNTTGPGGAGGNGIIGNSPVVQGEGGVGGAGGAGGSGGAGVGIYFDSVGNLLVVSSSTFDTNTSGDGGIGGSGGLGGNGFGPNRNGGAGGAAGAGGAGGDGVGIYLAAGTADLSGTLVSGNISGAGAVGGVGGNGGLGSDDFSSTDGGAGGAGGTGGDGGSGAGIFVASGNLTTSGASSVIDSNIGGDGGDGGNGGDGGSSVVIGGGGNAGPYGQNGAGGSGVGLHNEGTASLTDTGVTGNVGGQSGEFGIQGAVGTGPGGNGAPPINPSVFDMGVARGAGISNFNTLTLADVAVSGNNANRGAGIYNHLGTVDLLRVTLDSNSANPTGVTGATALEDGGGLLNVGGDVTVIDSAITNNFADYRGGGMSNRVFEPFGAEIAGFIDLKNVTISGNSVAAASQAVGGGIFTQGPTNSLDPMPATILNNVTVTDNSAPSGGGLNSLNFNNVVVANSIIADNTVLGAFFGDPAADCEGFTIRSGGNNVIGTLGADSGFGARCDSPQGFFDGVNGDQVGGIPPAVLDPVLGPLQNNGGTTETHELLAGSPAEDSGNGAATSDALIAIPGFADPLPTYVCRTTDQRGETRSTCDAGAYEVPVVPQTLQVGITSCSDISGAPYCTINAAVGDANASGGDTIEIIEDGTYIENVFIDRDLTIQATNPGGVIIDGNGAGRVISAISSPSVTLNGLVLTGGAATSGAGVNVGDASFTILDSAILGNVASGNGGGVFVGSGTLTLRRSSLTGNSGNRGGAIYMQGGGGTLDLFSSTISNNTSTQEGAAIYQQAGSTAMQNLTFTLNGGTTGVFFIGGGTATLRNTVAAGNTAGSTNPVCNGGGTVTSLGSNFVSRIGTACAGVFTQPGDITGTPADPADPRLGPLQDNGGVGLSHVPDSDSPLLDAGDNFGLDATFDQLGNDRVVDGIADGNNDADIGAVELDPLTVCASGCDYTFVEGVGGAQVAAGTSGLSNVIRLGAETFPSEFLRGNKDLIFQGSGRDATIVDAGPAATFRVAQARGGAQVIIRDLTLTGGNFAGAGGGVSVFEAGSDLTLERVRVTGNTAGQDGGGVENSQTVTIIDSLIDNNAAGSTGGGGVYTFGSGITTIIGSTITGNTAAASGGGVLTNGGAVSITNSTITGNTATGTNAGAIAVAAGTTTVNNSTLWDNAAGATYESVFQFGSGVITFSNSIVAEPDTGQLMCGGTIGSGDNNIVANTSGCSFAAQTFDQTGALGSVIDPVLGTLQDNGGPTDTLALLPGSPAVDGGNNGTCELTDQRGLTRIVGVACDIGAFELQVPVTLQGLIDAAPVGGTVNAPAGTYPENITLDKDVTVVGAGMGSTIVDGGAAGSVFDVLPGVTATISNLDIVNGSAPDGGGILVQAGADLTASAVTIANNTTSNRGGGAYVASGGRLTLDGGSVVTGNTETGFGWGTGLYVDANFDDALTISNVTFDDNDNDDKGGALYVQATCVAACGARQVLIENSLFTNSDTQNGGAAVFAWSGPGNTIEIVNTEFANNISGCPGFGGGCSEGGALLVDNGSGSVVIDNSRFHGNVADYAGGAITTYGGSLTITDSQFGTNAAPGALANRLESGSADGGGVIWQVSGTMSIDGSSFVGNTSTNNGGVLLLEGDSAAITDSTFTGNVANANGGAIIGSSLTNVTGSVFDSNFAGGDGGAIWHSGTPLFDIHTSTISNNTAGNFGGGIYNDGAFLSAMSTISGNTAQRGGGFYNTSTEVGVVLEIRNTTISGNSATAPAGPVIPGGGGIFNAGGSLVEPLLIFGSTIADNDAVTTDGGGVGNVSAGDNDLLFIHTIIANNTSAGSNPDCYSTSAISNFTRSFSNLIGIDGPGTCEVIANAQLLRGTAGSPLDPVLGPLADNGGLTLTQAITAASPAYDAVTAGVPLATDQRGVVRPQGAAADIGAFELAVAAGPLQTLIDAAGPGDTVVVPPGTYTENITIGDGKVLIGAGPGLTIIDGDFNGRTVELTGDATLQDLTVQNGLVGEGVGGNIYNDDFNLVLENVVVDNGSAGAGGNVFSSAGSLLINNSTISNGSVDGAGGGVFVDSPAIITNTIFDSNSADDGDGGGLYVAGGTIDVFGSTFTGNFAYNSGGGAYVNGGATLNIESSGSCSLAPTVGAFSPLTTFIANDSESGGGAITNNGTLYVYETLFDTNTAGTGGGGILHNGSLLWAQCSVFVDNAGGASGHAIDSGVVATVIFSSLFEGNGASGAAVTNSGTLSVIGSKFDGNSGQASAIDHSGSSYSGTGNEFVGHSGQAFFSQTSGGFTSTGSTWTANGNSGELGGALFVQDGDAVITGATFTGNIGDGGGAIYNNFNLTVRDSTFSGNLANSDGGAIATVSDLVAENSTFSGNTALVQGGALASVAGQIDVVGSTFAGNSATIADPFAGGAIYFSESGTVINSTLSGNLAPNGGGGAIAVVFKPVEIHNSTIVNNTSALAGAGVAAEPAGVPLAQFGNSIVALNTIGAGAANCSNTGSLGYNLFGSTGCGAIASDQEGGDGIDPPPLIDPVIGSLFDNGGPTQTHALLAGSPALDAGDPGTGAVITGAGDAVDLNGTAAAGIGNEVILTNAAGQAGTFFSTTPLDASQSFSATFDFQITNLSGFGGQPSGDGLTFALVDTPTALGDAAGRLGIGDTFGGPVATYNAVSVEFDTYANGIESGNHVGINVGTDLHPISTDAIFSDVELAAPGAFDDQSVWTAWVDYDALLKRMEVRFSNTAVRPTDAFIGLDIDLADQFTGSIYPGFTAGTGAAFATHTILDWAVSEASTCTINDQRGVARPQGAGCDVGAFEATNAIDLTLDLMSDPIVDSGASTIKTTDLPSELATQPTDPTDPTDDNIGSTPIANLDTQSTETESSPIANLPIANLEVNGTPIANLPIANLAPAAQEIIDAILLTEVPIEGGWDVHLALSTTGLNDRPIQSVTFGEAMADPGVLASLEAADLTFNDMNLASTPIANLTIAGLALGNLPIANLQLDPADTTPSEVLTTWCVVIDADPTSPTCAELGIVPGAGDDGGHSLASLSIAGADVSTLPIANIPIANLDTLSAPIANLPIANLPIANLPIANLELIDSPIANIPIANIPIANLGPNGLGISGLPIANLPIANLEVGGTPIANLPIANIPIANLELTDSPIANIPIANLYLGTAPIANLPIANLPIANLGSDGRVDTANSLPIANLPIANLPIANLGSLVDCSQPAVFDCDAPGATVGEAFVAGVLLGMVSDWVGYLSIDDLLELGVTDAAGTVFTLEDFTNAFVGTTLADLIPPGGQFADLGTITIQELADFLDMTLGELLVALIDAGLDINLGDVLLLLVNPEDYPWEDLELDGVNLQELDPTANPTVFTATANVTNGGGAAGQIAVTLPDDFLFTGVDVLGPPSYTFTVSGQTVVVSITAMPEGPTTVNVSSAASLSLGAAAATSTVTVGGAEVNAGTVLQVAEVLEPNDIPEQASVAVEDTLYLTHIAEQDDVDMYKIEGVNPGDRISVILSNMSEDFDLVLYQPELPPLRPGGVTPEGIATGVSDPGGYVDGDEQLQNEVSGDFPRAVYTQTTPLVSAGQPLKLYETSTQQGTSDEVITTATLQAAGDYYVQVHGSNGATSLDPYALRVEKIESPTSLACSALNKPFDGQGSTGGVFTAGPGPYNTLIIFNEKRLGEMYGPAAAADVRAALEDLAGQNALGVNAIVVPVDGNGDVATAYTAWDADRCNPLAANAVAAHIGQLVDDYRAANPTIEYITVIGDDAQIPFFRVPDYTEIANESEYALSVSATNNELVGSLLAGFILTDDPYGDAHPLIIDGRELYISELPMGRMVETPAQIIQSIGHFSTFNGRLDPSTASTGLSTGYDFIEDAALGIQAALDTDPRRTTTTLNTDVPPPWTSTDLSNAIDTLGPDLVSFGAHMSHDSLLSAAEDAAGTQADLYNTVDASNQVAGVFTGAILFSMGCHSGLSVSDVQVGATADWAQEFSELGAVYAAETGFGYGDTEFLAYGEELMRQFALRLNGTATVGQAMGFAKQYHAANLSQYSPYDEKVIMETVVYGLPFYAVGEPAVPPAPPVVPPVGTDAPTGLPVLTTSFDFGEGAPGTDGEFNLVTGSDRGDFYTAVPTGQPPAAGEAQVTAFNPIQPKAIQDVTQDGLVGTGVFISELTSVDIPNFDPVFSRPTVDLAAREPELSLPGTFPIVLPGINSYVDRTGERDQLVVVLGQFTDTDGIGEEGIERLFTHVEANVLYGDPTDQLLPTIRSVKATDTGAGGFLSFDVDAFDLDGTSATATDVERVYVLYKLVNVDGAWSELDLTKVSNHPDARWVGTVPSFGAKVEFIVQAIDSNGLVAVHSNKTAGNESVEAPAPQPGGLDIVVGGGPVDPVYTTDPVEIDIIGGDENDPIEVDVDGEGFEPYDGTPIPVSGEGPHTVTVTDGTEEDSVTFIIDTMAPDIFIASPLDGALYETGSALSALFSCTDAGVGVASCDATLDGTPIADGGAISTVTPGVHVLAVSASDGLPGHTSTASVTFEVADQAVLTVAPLLVPLGDPTTALLEFSPSTAHDHEVTFDWGDGTSDVCVESTCLDETLGTATASHTYATAGVYVITASVAHDGGGTQVVTSDFVVVYDASAGFVTGGGWFDSPFGAFTPQDTNDAEVTGKAHFGFNSKYKKGRTVPTGNTTFRLESSGFKFASTSYEWLVVSGEARAQFQGVGEIEGWNGVFSFRVTLRDAEGNDSDPFTEDAFRIRIWQDDGTEEGWVVYDNGFGVDDGSTHGGTTALGGGSIKIHVPKGGKGPR